MATADEMRAKFQEARSALREAIQGAGGWDAGSDDNWGAQRIAQHAIRSEVAYANRVSQAMEGRPQDVPDLQLASADEALAKEEEIAAMADKAFRYIEDRDLTKRAEVPGEYPQNVEGVLQGLTAHLNEHAEQIKGL